MPRVELVITVALRIVIIVKTCAIKSLKIKGVILKPEKKIRIVNEINATSIIS